MRKRVANAKVEELNPPRAGKKAVVLDIDYTIFDLNSSAERPEARCVAPHEFTGPKSVERHLLGCRLAIGCRWCCVATNTPTCCSC